MYDIRPDPSPPFDRAILGDDAGAAYASAAVATKLAQIEEDVRARLSKVLTGTREEQAKLIRAIAELQFRYELRLHDSPM